MTAPGVIADRDGESGGGTASTASTGGMGGTGTTGPTDAARAGEPWVDPAAPLVFIVNAAAGRHHADDVHQSIQRALDETGRRGEMRVTPSSELPRAAADAARQAALRHGVVVSVGGDGTTNAVAAAAHAAGCAMGLVAQGTFNYVARTHGLPTDAYEATRTLLRSRPQPVQVATVNEHLFLVNASVGLYPELLEDREAFKQRFGRNRVVAFISCVVTLLGRHRQLHLRIDSDGSTRRVVTPTLFVGNNRLQLEQVHLPEAAALDRGRIAGAVLRPVGSLRLLWLLLKGSMSGLADDASVEHFVFSHMRLRTGRGGRSEGRSLKVAFDGELLRLRTPLVFAVAPRPLWLLKPPPPLDASGHARTGIDPE
ncbi:MAG: diacylglycerol kinase [Pseudomonadota bacterium]|nr:diacylglycerol kinase [Pseudomonadota bacterium]